MSSQGGTTAPCRDSGQCTHAKHGYTRKDRPAPSLLPRTRPKNPVMAGWDHSVCWCLVRKPATEEVAG